MGKIVLSDKNSERVWKAAKGGQNVSCDFGRGGKRTIECALQNQFWRPQKVGFAWSVPVSSKGNNRAKTNGVGGTSWVGGSKTVFGKGLHVHGYALLQVLGAPQEGCSESKKKSPFSLWCSV